LVYLKEVRGLAPKETFLTLKAGYKMRKGMCSYYMKLHKKGNDVVLAVCDEELLGKYFTDGKLRLHIKEDFYGGSKVGREELLKALKEATIINAVGERSVSIVIGDNNVLKEAIIRICGIPHVQLIKF